jgi:hypothetical protein
MFRTSWWSSAFVPTHEGEHPSGAAVGELLEQPRRPFDVREQERDRAAVQLRHRPPPRLLDPHLVEERAPLRVVLVVADPGRNEVGPAAVRQRNPRGLADDVAVDLAPGSAAACGSLVCSELARAISASMRP